MELKKLKKILCSKGLWALIMLALLLLMRILFPSAIMEDDYWHRRFLRGFDFAGLITIGAGFILTIKGIAVKQLKQTAKGAAFVILGAAMLCLAFF